MGRKSEVNISPFANDNKSEKTLIIAQDLAQGVKNSTTNNKL